MQEQEEFFDAAANLLTAESRRVLDLAYQEMQTLSHWWIGTEHLLWGLASEGSLASFLTPLNVTAERVHAGIVCIFDRQVQQGQWIPKVPESGIPSDPLKLLTPRTRRVIILARDEAQNQGEKNVRPTHLLLALMNEGEGIGAGLLRSLGISLLQARTTLTPYTAQQICSFCGRNGSQVARLFPPEIGVHESNSPSNTLICNQCVERFHAMLGSA